MMPKRNGIKIDLANRPMVTCFVSFIRSAIPSGKSAIRYGLSCSILCGVAGSMRIQAQSTASVSTRKSPPAPRALGQVPGLESFAVQPETPLELIKAIDYLVRVGLEEQAVPLAQKLINAETNDESLYELGLNVGSSKLLALESTSNGTLNGLMERFANKVNTASKTVANDSDRIRRLIDKLSASPEEREVAVERLARIGTAVVEPLIKALTEEGTTASKRRQIQFALNRLESSAVPGLVGVLRHPEASVRAAVAEALGYIGDPRALPWLVHESVKTDAGGVAARDAVKLLTAGRSSGDPTRFLTNEASKYLDRDVLFLDPEVEGWFWNAKENRLSSVVMPAEIARGSIGYRLSRMALDSDPKDQAAQAIAISMLFDEESRRLGDAFPDEDPLGVWSIALASGPQTLTNVLNRALLTGRHENVAVLASRALGEITTNSDLNQSGGQPHVLVQALDSPDRRVQFAAAQALLNQFPDRPFPGSSRVVQAMSRFLPANPNVPRAVVIHDNVTEGGNWVDYLRHAGYDAVLETSSTDGFHEVARRGDVELVLVSTFLDPSGWALHETAANFQADARTSGIPLIVVGPLDAKTRLRTLLGKQDRIGFMVSPVDQSWMDRQLEQLFRTMRHDPLNEVERRTYRDEASRSLGRLKASEKGTPMRSMLDSLEPHLKNMLIETQAEPDLPLSVKDRQSLVDSVLADGSDISERIRSANRLAEDIRKTGNGLSNADKKRIEDLFLKFENEKDKDLRVPVARLAGLNKPTDDTVAKMLTKYAPGAAFYEEMRANR